MRSFLLLLVVTVIHSTVLFGQQLDETFHSPVSFRPAYTTRLVRQPDGNILMAGNIDYYTNTPVHNLIRIRPDGSLDASFSFTSPFGYYVSDLDVRDNGEIVLLLNETDANRDWIQPQAKVMVLDQNGAIKRQSETSDYATLIAVQPDGKIVVGGWPYTGFFVMRYNEDLSKDNLFNVSLDKGLSDIKVSGDKLFLAGSFKTVNGVAKANIVKLNLDGSIDNTFDTGTGLGPNSNIGSITFAPDGKILSGQGYVNSYNGQPCQGSIRLNSDGTLDGTFTPSINSRSADPLATIEGIYVFAYLQIGLDPAADYLVRLNDDGSLDPDFKPVRIQSEQNATKPVMIAVGDDLLTTGAVVGGNPYQLSKVDKNGTVDPAFAPRISRLGLIRFGDEQNGNLIVGGDFLRIDSLNTFGMARLKSDGAVDDSFVMKENYGSASQMHLFEDETALVTTTKHFFKLDNHGSVLPDFNWAPGGSLYNVMRFKVLDNGQIMASDLNTVARLNANGSFDETFNFDPPGSSTGFSFDMQGDSLIFGYLVWNNGQPEASPTSVARFTPSGDLDVTFKLKSGPGATDPNAATLIFMVKVLDNKEVLVGGAFDIFDGVHVPHGLVKLSRDGKMDSTFNANQALDSGPIGFYDPNVEQIGSKIYMRSDNSIYVINLDGTVDSWEIPVTANDISAIIAIRSNNPSQGGRTKSDKDYIIALGSFQSAQSHLSIVKIDLTQKPEEPGTVTGVETKHASLALEIYPQPTSGILNIKFDDRADFNTTVYNSSGLKVMEKSFNGKANNDATSLDVSQVPPGFYTLKVVSKSGKSGYSKFIRVP